MKAQTYIRFEDIHIDFDADIDMMYIKRYVIKKQAEFDRNQNPAALKKLCTLTVRDNLACKTEENFARLGLPPALLSLVMHHTLAEEIDLMLNHITTDIDTSS